MAGPVGVVFTSGARWCGSAAAAVCTVCEAACTAWWMVSPRPAISVSAPQARPNSRCGTSWRSGSLSATDSRSPPRTQTTSSRAASPTASSSEASSTTVRTVPGTSTASTTPAPTEAGASATSRNFSRPSTSSTVAAPR